MKIRNEQGQAKAFLRTVLEIILCHQPEVEQQVFPVGTCYPVIGHHPRQAQPFSQLYAYSSL